MASRCEILKAISVIADEADWDNVTWKMSAFDVIKGLAETLLEQEAFRSGDSDEDGKADSAEGYAQPGYTPDLPNPWYRSQDGLAYFHQPSGLQIVWEPDMERWQVEFPGDRMRRGSFDDPSVAANWAEVEFARMAMQRANEKPG